MTKLNDAQLAYVLLRFTFGINLALHGVNRLFGGVQTFAAKLADDFATTILPRVLVWPFGVALPFVELTLGTLLIAGAFTRFALVVGSLLMAALTFGTALRGEWNTLGIQLIYSLVYYLLLSRRSDDAYNLDRRLQPVAGRAKSDSSRD